MRYTREYLAQFPADAPERVILFERAQADALGELGRPAEAEARYADLVARFPDQGWVYIAWTDLYWLNRRVPADYERAAAILQQGLARPKLQDRQDVLMRVGEVNAAGGRPRPPGAAAPGPRAPVRRWARNWAATTAAGAVAARNTRTAIAPPIGSRGEIVGWAGAEGEARADVADPRVDAYIAELPPWQQQICRQVRELVHAADPQVGETMVRQIIANNRAGGWRKL